jgi:hypothetical protein
MTIDVNKRIALEGGALKWKMILKSW